MGQQMVRRGTEARKDEEACVLPPHIITLQIFFGSPLGTHRVRNIYGPFIPAGSHGLGADITQ